MISRLLAVSVLCAVLSAAHADDNAAASAALRGGRYETVLALTKRVAISEPASAINWYRMSIAATRLGDTDLGALALTNARLQDPSLSFASTPQRVEALQADIDRGVGAAPSVEQLSQDARELFRQEMATAAVPVPAPVPVPDAKLLQLVGSLGEKLDRVESGLGAANKGAWHVAQPWIVGFISFCVLLVGGFAVFISRRAKEIRESSEKMRLSDVASMPLAKMIAFNRDHTEMLRQRLKHHGRQDTALVQAIGQYLPAVELEAGRVDVSIEVSAPGVMMVDDVEALEAARPVLGLADAGQLHQAALSRALGQFDGKNRRAA